MKIIVLMGRSGSGKDTMLRRLLAQTPSLRPLTLYTTRPRRFEGEGGYIFVTRERLSELISRYGCVERRDYDTVHGVWSYATIDDGSLTGNLACVLTPAALAAYRRHFGAERILPVLLEVDCKTLLLRAIKRESARSSPGYEELCRRFLADSDDFSDEKLGALEPLVRLQNEGRDGCFAKLKAFSEEFLASE